MRSRAVVASLAVLSVAVIASGCAKKEEPKPGAPAPAPAAAPAAPAADGKALFEQKCGVCHGIDRAAVRSETKQAWAEIVKTMQGKKADWISDAEAARIVDYLAAEHGKK